MRRYSLPRAAFDLLIEALGQKQKAEIFAKAIESAIEAIDKQEADVLVVKTDEFSEIKEIVKELAIAQKKSEERLAGTEERLTRIELLVEDLTEAQKRTEERVEELAEAQKRTEEELKELANEVKELAVGLGKTNKQLGGISHTIGFRLEDESYKALPGLLERSFGIIVKDALKRRHIKDKKGNYIEINIIGEAFRDGRKVTIIGEGKSQLSKNDVDDFIKKKIKRVEGVFDEILPLLITYMTQEYDVEEYAKQKGIALFYSYDF